jgi:predicted nucleic acid-binding protein
MSNAPDRLVISNTSPLFYLHRIRHLHLLPQLYGEIWLPPAVEEELEEGRRQGYDVPDVRGAEGLGVRELRSPPSIPAIVDLGPGEAEVLTLGMEYPGSLLIIDEQQARRIAGLQGLSYTGTLGVLIKAKKATLIPSMKSLLEELQRRGMWIGADVAQAVLKLADE